MEETVGPECKGVTTYWIVKAGLRLKDMGSLLDEKRKSLPSLNFMIIRCGANMI